MRLIAPFVWLVAALALSCCITVDVDNAPSQPPAVDRAPGEPAPTQARFYADCIGASAAAGTYLKEPGENHLRFTCSGRAAHAFYDALNSWSTSQGSEYIAEGRTWRFTQKLIKDTVGVDDCSTDGAGDYRCTVVLNVGEFLSAN